MRVRMLLNSRMRVHLTAILEVWKCVQTVSKTLLKICSRIERRSRSVLMPEPESITKLLSWRQPDQKFVIDSG
jgi:hypothetical protein